MAFIRCADQSSPTFKETFERLGEANELLRAKSLDMIKLIDYLMTLFKGIDVYAFTTHGDLWFVSGVNTNDPIRKQFISCACHFALHRYHLIHSLAHPFLSCNPLSVPSCYE
ncbi:MAG: DUF1655 domain-containing protein [Bacteroidota bacterium]